MLESDARIVLITGGGTWPITTKPWTAEQIEAAFQEILPPGANPAVTDAKGFRFRYASPHGMFRASFTRKDGRAHLVMQPIMAEGSEVEPPAARTSAAPRAQSGTPALVALFQKMIDEG